MWDRSMRMTDAAAQLAVGAATAIFAWGAMSMTVKDVKEDVKDLMGWKDTAIEKMSNMDAKLDLLLQANGVTFKKR